MINFRAFKLQFLKILLYYAKDHILKKFYKFIKDLLIVFLVYELLYNIQIKFYIILRGVVT